MATEKTDTLALTSAAVAELFKNHQQRDPDLVKRFNNPVLDQAAKDELREAMHQAKHSAKNLEELLEGGGMLNGRDYLNKPFQIERVDWRMSDIEGEGLDFFAILGIVDAYGEARRLATGGENVVESIALGDAGGFFQPIGGFAQWVKFVGVPLTDAEGKPIGRTALELHITDAPYGGPKS